MDDTGVQWTAYAARDTHFQFGHTVQPSFDDHTESAPSSLVRGSCFGEMRPEICDEDYSL